MSTPYHGPFAVWSGLVKCNVSNVKYNVSDVGRLVAHSRI